MFITIRFIIITYLCLVCSGSRQIFDTNIVPGSDGAFDCLIYTYEDRAIDERFDMRTSPWHVRTEIHRFCRRLTFSDNQDMLSMEQPIINHHPAFTFEDLRSMNITSKQLYEWYAPLDLIEDYFSGNSTGLFVNCSNTLWFGSNCEYTFDTSRSFHDFIVSRFNAKANVPTDLSLFTNGTCYEIFDAECESILCLDWREICDGKIDCKNGFDEQHCQQLEINECNQSSEHRCFDGHCIENFYGIESTPLEMDCSEEYYEPELMDCHTTSKEKCENQKCAPLLFSCGDGYCYDGPSHGSKSCPTHRDQHYFKQMSSILILFSHIHLIYKNTQPQAICYNETLCPYLSFSNNLINTTYNSDGLTCRTYETFSKKTYTEFDEMVKDVKRHVRSCSLLPFNYNHPNKTCSMYQCEDGSKCLSFHRLSDSFNDCTNGEDEHHPNVCSFNLPGRFTCDNGTKCIFQKWTFDGYEHCSDKTDESLAVLSLIKCPNPFSDNCPIVKQYPLADIIEFDEICNGVVEYIIDGNNNTDETDCLITEWSCDRNRMKCDRFWNCPDGHDELGCSLNTLSSIHCNNTKHFCFNITNGQPICLSRININDGIIQCLGSADEREFCRKQYPYMTDHRYRCLNSTKCISILSICDCNQDCPENDDETIACDWLRNGKNRPCASGGDVKCYGYSSDLGTTNDAFCDLEDKQWISFWKWNRQKQNSPIIKQNQLEKQSSENTDVSIIWSCNRGIYIRSKKDSSGFACFCSEYYYGDRCQYQRKRIKLLLQMNIISAFNHRVSAFKFVILLVHINKTSTTIVYHDQLIYIPRYECSPKFYVPLLYPIKRPNRSFVNHAIHIHLFDIDTLEHRYSWSFPLQFEFLPVETIAKRLLVPEMSNPIEAKHTSFPYTNHSSCSNTARYLGHDVSLARDICVCLSNYTGRRCLIPFDPCTNSSCSEHGECKPLNVQRDVSVPFHCLCQPGWFGYRCQYPTGRVHVSFSQDVISLSSNIIFLHLVEVFAYSRIPTHFVYFHNSYNETSNLTFYLNNTFWSLDGVFIQFYEHQYKFDYYLLYLHEVNEGMQRIISTEVQLSHRCRPINELFDNDILVQPVMRRVKNYQRPCLERQDQLLCFYDEHLMCLCMEDNTTHCIAFQTNLDTCDKKWCNDRGMCVQDHHTCLLHSQCICEPCAYGRFCQFSTGGYTLSLDGIIGSHILTSATSLSEQSEVIQVSVGIIIVIVLIGILLNILSLCTFVQRETHTVGCGLYLLASSIIGLLTMLVLVCKIILLLTDNQSNAGCSSVEFLLRWCPSSCEWLNAGVAVERTVAVKRKMRYSRIKSKFYAKWMTSAILIFVGLVSMPELFFRRIIIDQLDERTWCVLTLNSNRPTLLAFYSVLNVFSFLTPLIINLSSAMIIIMGTLKSKQNINQNRQRNVNEKKSWKTYWSTLKKHILEHKHILITPILLALLSLPRLILTFIFVCAKLDQHSIPSLIAYLIGFLPTMAILFAFVLPSETYRTALKTGLKKVVPRHVLNLCKC